MKRVVGVVMLVAPLTVHADAPDVDEPQLAVRSTGYVAAGFDTTVSLFSDTDEAAFIEGGYKLKNAPIVMHALVGRGHHIDNPGWHGGDSLPNQMYSTARAGVVVEKCTRGEGACLFAGAEVGVLAFDDGRRSPAVVPQIGFDVGGRAVRFRFMVDTRRTQPDSAMDESPRPRGGITAALAHRF